MQADHFRQLYRYHYAIQQKIWDEVISQISDEQFVQALPYSNPNHFGKIRQKIRMYCGTYKIKNPFRTSYRLKQGKTYY